MVFQVNDIKLEKISNGDAVHVLSEAAQKPGPTKLVVAKCGDPNPTGYFTYPVTGPACQIDPATWVAGIEVAKDGVQSLGDIPHSGKMPEFDQFLDESFADLDASFPLYQALLEEDFAVNSPDKVAKEIKPYHLSCAKFTFDEKGPKKTEHLYGWDVSDILSAGDPFINSLPGICKPLKSLKVRAKKSKKKKLPVKLKSRGYCPPSPHDVYNARSPGFYEMLCEKLNKVIEDRKLEGRESESSEESDSSVEDSENKPEYDYGCLPEIVVFKILDYLSFSEAMKFGRVCHTWYQASRSVQRERAKVTINNGSLVSSLILALPKTLRSLWVNVKMENMVKVLSGLILHPKTLRNLELEVTIKKAGYVSNLLKALPVTLTSLRVHCPDKASEAYFLLKDMFDKLRYQCPKLQYLSIDHGVLFYDKTNFTAIMGHVNTSYSLKNIRTHDLIAGSEMLHEDRRFYIELEYLDREYYRLIKSRKSLRCEMTTLSFAHSILDPRIILKCPYPVSYIKVLDLSYCKSLTDNAIHFFPTLSNLEELYLAGSPLTYEGIGHIFGKVTNLKKLDLEDTNIEDGTLLRIQLLLKGLTELYLGFANILCHSHIFNDLKNRSNLRTICLKNSRLFPSGNEYQLETDYFELVKGNPESGMRESVSEEVRFCNHFGENHI